MNKLCIGFTILVLNWTSACKHLPFATNEYQGDGLPDGTSGELLSIADRHHRRSENQSTRISAEQMELKMARLWSKVDSLEATIRQQDAKVRVLERGMVLGLVPESLKESFARNSAQVPAENLNSEVDESTDLKMTRSSASGDLSGDSKNHLNEERDLGNLNYRLTNNRAQENSADESPALGNRLASSNRQPSLEARVPGEAFGKAGPAITASTVGPEQREAFQKALASAHDHFRSGRYGRSVVEFADLGQQFPGLTRNGLHRYWIALSWVRLKEYNTAQQQFLDFINDYGESPWLPRVKLELARLEWQLGMRDGARSRLSRIVREYPYEDVAELARMELKSLEARL